MPHLVSTPKHATRLGAVCAVLAACSLQDFDYLQGGASNAGAGGSGGAGGGVTQGGKDTNPESGAGAESDAGHAGSHAAGTTNGGTGTTGGGEAGETNVGGAGGAAGGAGGAAGDGSGAVGEIVNASFETHSTAGWTVEPADALNQRYVFVQGAQGTATIQDGTYELSTWHDKASFQLEIYQNVKGLEDGTYTFKGYFTVGPSFKSLQMFARNCGGAAVPPRTLSSTAVDEWLPVELTGIEVVGGSCEVGLAVESNPGNWMNADLFSLEKVTTTTN